MTGPSAGVTGYELEDETLLFLHDTGKLLRLNSTAAFVWRGIELGLTAGEIVELIAEASGAPIDVVERDVTTLIKGLQDAGALGGTSRITEGPIPPTSPDVHPVSKAIRRNSHAHERRYRLLDFEFRLRTPSIAIDSETRGLLGHLSQSDTGNPSSIVEVVEDGGAWFLLRDDDVVSRCDSFTQVIPMLHVNLLLAAYRSSDSLAALHAGAVTRGDRCVLLPATSGSGKSTLTAALTAFGFGYCTDDLALLTQAPLRVRGVPSCMGLKTGSWNVLRPFIPGIETLPIHQRFDGKQVRYLPPLQGAPDPLDSFKTQLIVFPEWSAGSPIQLRRVSSADALTRLTTAGYDLPNQINAVVVESLIRWISTIPCYELRYDSLEEAGRTISGLME